MAKRENKTIDNREKGDNRYGETNGHAGAESLLEKNGVRKLYHFTDRDNLASIIRHGGLYSWADCADKGIDIPKLGSDQMSRSLDARDGLEHYVRVSFVTSHPMMFVAMNDGNVILFNIHISADKAACVLCPPSKAEVKNNDLATTLYEMSSLLPSRYSAQVAGLRNDTSPCDRYTAMTINADMSALIQLMDIGTPTNISQN